MRHYPRISLAIDNCFASKRWTRPDEWARLIRDLGIKAIETSADTECDPLYGGLDYLRDWTREVKEAEAAHGVKVVNMYSGHGTYATLGLSHTDPRVADRMLNEWLFPLIDVAGQLDAGVGFYCHAFPQSTLDDAERYERAIGDLCSRLAAIASYATGKLHRPIGVEQMYSPHQYPWRIADAERVMTEVTRRAGAPFYALLDVGHQSGQHRFQRPDRPAIAASLRSAGGGADAWIGPPRADALRLRARAGEIDIEDAVDQIERLHADSAHLFAESHDTDPYAWLERLGAHSPIVHLQQTTGRASAHLPFTDEHNANGIITGSRVLGALRKSVERESPTTPPAVDHIYLTIEIFAGTAEHPSAIIDKLDKSVRYWRQFVPQDGATLDTLTQGTE